MKLIVTWDSSRNGGSLNGSGSTTTAVDKYSNATPPTGTPVKTGHEFSGWYTSASGGSLYNTVSITEPTTFYAQFTPCEYNISWDTQFFEVLHTSQTYGKNLVLPEEPTHARYNFVGWFTESVGGTEVTASLIYNTAGESTYFAHWEAKPDVFSVTVPAVLVLTVSEQGIVYSADNAAIVNNSTDKVKVSSVAVSAENGWKIVPFNNNMSAEKVDANVIGFSLNNVSTSIRGSSETLNLLNSWTISEGNSLPITYDAVVSAVSEAVNKQVLTVIFVLDWDR